MSREQGDPLLLRGSLMSPFGWFDSVKAPEVFDRLKGWLNSAHDLGEETNVWISDGKRWRAAEPKIRAKKFMTFVIADDPESFDSIDVSFSKRGTGISSSLGSVSVRAQKGVDLSVMDGLFGGLGIFQVTPLEKLHPMTDEWWGFRVVDPSFCVSPEILNSRLVGIDSSEFWVSKSFQYSDELLARMPTNCGIEEMQFGHWLRFKGPGVARMAIEKSGFAGWKAVDRFIVNAPPEPVVVPAFAPFTTDGMGFVTVGKPSIECDLSKVFEAVGWLLSTSFGVVDPLLLKASSRSGVTKPPAIQIAVATLTSVTSESLQDFCTVERLAEANLYPFTVRPVSEEDCELVLEITLRYVTFLRSVAASGQSIKRHTESV
jgi:hypothetical protein